MVPQVFVRGCRPRKRRRGPVHKEAALRVADEQPRATGTGYVVDVPVPLLARHVIVVRPRLVVGSDAVLGQIGRMYGAVPRLVDIAEGMQAGGLG
jgi:hypothetical protein